MKPEKPVSDVLGVAPYDEALKIAVEKTAETAVQFFNAICLPAASEVGLLLRDKVRIWRARNLANIAVKAQPLVTVGADGVQLLAHPRIVAEVVEHGSWCEDEKLQDMWAGLLASSCTKDGKDECNLLFIDLLKRMTTNEARFLHAACERTRGGWGANVELKDSEIAELFGTNDTEVVAYQLQHLSSLGLIRGMDDRHAYVSPFHNHPASPKELGLHLYIRCKGSRQSPAEFFGWKNLYTEYPHLSTDKP